MMLRTILAMYPDAMWSDGTLWHSTDDILSGWGDVNLDHPATLRHTAFVSDPTLQTTTLYFLNPVTGIMLGGLALQEVTQ